MDVVLLARRGIGQLDNASYTLYCSSSGRNWFATPPNQNRAPIGTPNAPLVDFPDYLLQGLPKSVPGQ